MPTIRLEDGTGLKVPDGLNDQQLSEVVETYHQSKGGGAQAPAEQPSDDEGGILSTIGKTLAQDEAGFLDYVPGAGLLADIPDVISDGFNSPEIVERRGRREEAARSSIPTVTSAALGTAGAAIGGVPGAAVGSGLGDAAGQLLAHGDVDLQQAALSTVLGGAGQKVGDVAGNLLGRFLPAGDEALAIAKEADELNIPLTRGQASGQEGRLIREETIRQGDTAGSGILNEFADQQQGAIRGAADDIVPGASSATPGSAGTEGIAKLTEARDAQRQIVREAYKAAENTSGTLDGEAFAPLIKNISDHVDEFSGFDTGLKQKLGDSLNGISSAAAEIGEEGAASITQIDTIRKQLNRTINAASGPDKAAEKAGLLGVKGIFDEWLDDAVEGAFFAGDEASIQAIKKARGLSAQYKSRFASGPGDPAGKIVDKLLDESVPDSVNFLFGASKLGKVGTGEAVNRIAKASPEALDEFRKAGWAKIANDSQGAPKSAGMLAKSIRENLQSSPDLMNSLYDKPMIAKMQKLSRVIDATKTPANALNPSRSGWTLMREIRKGLGVGGAVLGALGDVTTGGALLATSAAPTVRGFLGARSAVKALPETGAARAAAAGLAPTVGRIGGNVLSPDRDQGLKSSIYSALAEPVSPDDQRAEQARRSLLLGQFSQADQQLQAGKPLQGGQP